MLVLGIETTCDETGCAIVKDGKEILSNAISSQIDLHSVYGGVLPELAARRHVDILPQLLEEALAQAKVKLEEIDLIAVAAGPGLLGALLVGLHFAKGLSFMTGKPLIGVNHVKAHLFSPFIDATIPLPSLGCVISGGHTALLHIKEEFEYELIGTTQDDAVGEAFDKVASLLNLPYPGGPHIEELAKKGNPTKFPFKIRELQGRPYDFSYSGLKTAVLYLVKGQNGTKKGPLVIAQEEKQDVAASFQRAALTVIVQKTLHAAKNHGCKSIVLGGGVSNNLELKRFFEIESTLPVFWPPKGLSLDNGAMIGALGYHEYLKRGADTLDLEPFPRMEF